MTKQKSISLGLITLVITLVITMALAGYYINSTSSSRKERANFIANSIGDRIEAEIDNREYIARVFEIQLRSSRGELNQENFFDISDALFDDYLDVYDISLAPNGVVEYVYPADSSLKKGANFFEDARFGVYADYSKMSKVSVIIAPATLNDNESGIIITKPIFLEDESFWGFATVTVDEKLFMTDVNLPGLADGGYEYKLIGNNSITGENRIIVESTSKSLAEPVEAMISTVGGAFWTLYLEPSQSWVRWPEVLSAAAIALIISALTAMFMYAYMNMKSNAKELEVLSYRDALTNLYNPRSYHEHMDELSAKKLPFGIIYMDLNDFKMVNDTYGHDTGDALLNITAKRLKNSIREKDRAFRIGGDEFVVVIHGTHDKKFYEGVISRMRQNVARDVVIGDITLKVSISAGYARCPEDGSKLEDVIKKADDAMYYNKRLLKARRAQENGQGTANDIR
ncbi:sensor domain-containing diguanylate cyclase [Butyrivibrio sp. VCB2006]|uniref:sensor domain-containing diguanylate cyclase n=1 Tax=Butyrivibrio sp. VCB2006 TaxID=1280679 RepID=UPI00042853B7|nr:sensor domain-containing diguanylate cyclase [Butyrivibrio sp. VCB2006]